MKKYLAILFISLLGVTANAGIISFEGLMTDNNTYQHYLWSASSSVGDWGVADCATIDCMGIQPLEAVSGTSYGWTFYGPQSLFIDFGEATDVGEAD